MLINFLSSEKIITNNNSEYFKISPKQKLILDFKKSKDNIVKEASINIERKLMEIGR